jgi:uncharacterized membrane protein
MEEEDVYFPCHTLLKLAVLVGVWVLSFALYLFSFLPVLGLCLFFLVYRLFLPHRRPPAAVRHTSGMCTG